MHLLVIDDSRTCRSILRNMLEELGHEVTEAENGLEALQSLQGDRPVELALVDWEMPELDGIEFVRTVRDDPRYSDVKLVMVTKQTRLEHVQQALSAGADEYIMKPFTLDVIREKLELLGVSTQT